MYGMYLKNKEGIDIEYQGGLNFADGKRTCPNCKSLMERMPIGEPFIRVEHGKILVESRPSDGKLMVKNPEVSYLWTCTKKDCHTAISTTKNKFPVDSPV